MTKKHEGQPLLDGAQPPAATTASPEIPEAEFDTTWKPGSNVNAKFDHYQFKFSLSFTRPPKKPDGEPFQ